MIYQDIYQIINDVLLGLSKPENKGVFENLYAHPIWSKKEMEDRCEAIKKFFESEKHIKLECSVSLRDDIKNINHARYILEVKASWV